MPLEREGTIMKKVIINADDFGMSEAVNYGVIKSYTEGVVSSVSLIVNLPTSEHAVMLAKNYPDMFIGQHTNFVLGKPCSNPSTIPTLVDENGNFYRSHVYRSGKKKFFYEDIKKETIAQMNQFKSLMGFYPEHIEGHAVESEVINQVFIDIAIEFNIHYSLLSNSRAAERNSESNYLEIINPEPSIYSQIINRGVTIENFISDDFGILKIPENKIMELHFHPGYIDEFVLRNSSLTLPRCRDLATLCDPRLKEWFLKNEIELISFKDIKL